jgi:cytidylate kinase
MGYQYLDTGAMYRGVAYAYLKLKPDNLETFLSRIALRFSFGKEIKVRLGEEDVSDKIRTSEISLLASSLSQDRLVRAYLTGLQRDMAKKGGVVVEGRDTGSVVFPDADIKFYLDADIGERTRRRHLELESKNVNEDVRKVREEMEKRDRDDSQREIAPLIRPEGAVYIDTTGKSLEEVVRTLEAHIRQVHT